MRGVPRKRAGFLLLTVSVAVAACAAYHAKPLDEQGAKNVLRPPDMAHIRVQVRELKHPILKPVELDETKGLSPDGVAVIAVVANPALKAVRSKRGVAVSQLLQAGILPNPQLTYSWDKPTSGDTQGTVTAFGFSLSWDLVPLLVRGAQIDSAKAELASVDLDVAWQEWQAAVAAKAHVYNVILLKQEIDATQKQKDALKNNLETTKKAFDYGDVTQVDLSAAQVALEKVRASELALGQQFEQERLSLNQSVGFPPNLVVPLQRDIVVPSIEKAPGLQEMMEEIEYRRLDLVALRRGYESQEARVRAAVISQFPSLSIGPTHARDTSNVITTGFSATIAIPIFNRNQGQIAIEQTTRQQLYDEYYARLYEARSSIAAIIANMASIEAQVDVAEETLPMASKLADTYRTALIEGHADVVTYYNALNDLYARQIELISFKKDLCGQIIALEAASGRLVTHVSAPGISSK